MGKKFHTCQICKGDGYVGQEHLRPSERKKCFCCDGLKIVRYSGEKKIRMSVVKMIPGGFEIGQKYVRMVSNVMTEVC
jgi:hypothetical protein